MPILEAQNLTKKFSRFRKKDFTAVNDISFTLKEGEILGLLGPNGAGKTTTIQMLLGILTPTVGEVFYFGKKLKTHREEILEQVNFSSTYTNMPWDLTVRENLLCLSYLYDIPHREARLRKITELFKLQELLNQKIRNLSAGQLTRANLAKSFLNFPRVLLLDEPTASLDPEVAQYVREFLLEERKKFNISIILTSHNMAEVEEVCDRVIFIDDGILVADDTPENLSRSIEMAHVTLLMPARIESAVAYCEEQSYKFAVAHHSITIDLRESEIPSLLNGLMKRNIRFTNIGIEKATLEDYFLQVMHKHPTEQL